MSPTYLLALSWLLVYKTAPLTGWAMNFAGPGARAAQAPASAPIDFDGEAIEGDLPATYRLPPVRSARLATAAGGTQGVPLFSPPSSPDFLPPPPPMTCHAAVKELPQLVPVDQSPTQETRNGSETAPLPPGDGSSAAGSARSSYPLPIEEDFGMASPNSPIPAGSPPDEHVADDCQSDVEFEPVLPPLAGPPQEAIEVARFGPVAQASVPPAATELATQLLPAVQRGYELAQRGALFAARTEFVQVLRRVAQAKDMAAHSDEHSQALAAGLRALDEADDFVPEGVQLEAELDVRATASSHRTPALPEGTERILPHEAVALYHDFAKEQLAMAVVGEQAGSMALYGLGRIDAQLAARKDDDVRFVRGAMTMYAAALRACPHNHLAANELGVLECRTGRPAEAARLFERTIDFAPSATAYHNLAVAQQKLGLIAHAQANEQESHRLAAWERSNGALSRRAGVRWVTPEEMARVAQPAGLTPAPTHAVNAPPPFRSPWRRTIELARSLPRPGSQSDTEAPVGPTPDTRVVWPTMRSSETRWR